MISIKMHSNKSRFVIGPSNILSEGVYAYTFQPGNFTCWGSEGVRVAELTTTAVTVAMMLVLHAVTMNE